MLSTILASVKTEHGLQEAAYVDLKDHRQFAQIKIGDKVKIRLTSYLPWSPYLKVIGIVDQATQKQLTSAGDGEFEFQLTSTWI